MFFYLILITCVLIFSGVLFRRGSKSGYVFVSLLLTVIACIRFDVGWDYPSYYRALDETFLPILTGAGIIFARCSGLNSWFNVAIVTLCPNKQPSPIVIPP